MDIHGLSEINFGLIILGIKTANMYDPDVFTEPYSQAVEWLKKHPSKDVEDCMSLMAPSEFSAAKHAAISVNGLGKTHDWQRDQIKAFKAYKLGDSLIKAGNRYKKNEPVEILPLQGQIQSVVSEELTSGLTKLKDIDYKNFQPFQDSGWDVIDNIFGGIPASGLMVVFGETGVGKCLAKGTKVLMFDGSVKSVEDIKVGDLVMGPDSTSRTVLSLSRGMDEMYDVIPTKGEKYTVNSEHILSLRITNQGSESRKKIKGGDIINLPVKEYLAKSKTFRHSAKGWRVGTEFEKKEVPLEPYFIGAWLGDGNSDTPNITNMDQEVIDYVYEYADRLELIVGKYYDDNRASVYRISTGIPGHPNPLWNKLKELDLINNKHIPNIYKINSKDARCELLAGIIDTDGSYSQNCYDLVFKNETLANDIVFVARSLGLAAYVKPCIKTCTNNGKSGEYHRITISGDIDIIPVKIPRKKAAARQQKKNVLNVGIHVEPAGYGEYFGFELDGDRLFVLGDFTVTHNSFWLSKLMDTFLKKHKKKTGATYTLEMTSEEYAQRSVSMYPDLFKSSDRFYISGNARTIDEIVSEVSSKRLDIVGIDFVDWLVRDKQGGEGAYAYVYMTCVELARILKIPVVMLAQPNREGYKYPKFLTKTDIRWSGAAEFSAWQLIGLQAVNGLGFEDTKYPTFDEEHFYMIGLKQRGGWPKQEGPGAIILKPQKGKGKWEGEVVKNKIWRPGDYNSSQVIGSRKEHGNDRPRNSNRR